MNQSERFRGNLSDWEICASIKATSSAFSMNPPKNRRHSNSHVIVGREVKAALEAMKQYSAGLFFLADFDNTGICPALVWVTLSTGKYWRYIVGEFSGRGYLSERAEGRLWLPSVKRKNAGEALDYLRGLVLSVEVAMAQGRAELVDKFIALEILHLPLSEAHSDLPALLHATVARCIMYKNQRPYAAVFATRLTSFALAEYLVYHDGLEQQVVSLLQVGIRGPCHRRELDWACGRQVSEAKLVQDLILRHKLNIPEGVEL